MADFISVVYWRLDNSLQSVIFANLLASLNSASGPINSHVYNDRARTYFPPIFTTSQTIYIYIYTKRIAMCPPGYHHNGFMATPELGHRMYGYTL